MIGSIVVNPATGNAYFTRDGVPHRVRPKSYGISATGLGAVMAVNGSTNRLYATTGNGMQIVDGATDGIITTVPLPSTPTAAAVLTGRNRVYVSTQTDLVVLDGATNRPLWTLALGSDFSPHAIAIDSARRTAYVLGHAANGKVFLKVVGFQ
ncbi:MAG: YncE family protein [Gemmatimonadaceae bacterium]